MNIRVFSKECDKSRDTNNVQWALRIMNTLGNCVYVVLISLLVSTRRRLPTNFVVVVRPSAFSSATHMGLNWTEKSLVSLLMIAVVEYSMTNIIPSVSHEKER